MLAWPLIVSEYGNDAHVMSALMLQHCITRDLLVACHCGAAHVDVLLRGQDDDGSSLRFLQQAQGYYQMAYHVAYRLDAPILHLSLCHNLVALAHQASDEEALDLGHGCCPSDNM